MPKTRDRDLEVRFQALLSEHRERAVRMAWRLAGELDREAAEDIAQEAFIRAWRALPTFRDEASLTTWFYRILVRQAANHRRGRGTLRRVLGLFGLEPQPVYAEANHPDSGLKRRIHEAVGKLSAGQREAFVLVHLEGLTVTQAAELTGRAEGTLKSHLHRALTALRAELSELMEAP